MFSLFIFLCRLSVWCLFFVINGLKVAHHYFIHDKYELSACQCVGCLSFFANIMLISSLNVLIIIVYLCRMVGKESTNSLQSMVILYRCIFLRYCKSLFEWKSLLSFDWCMTMMNAKNYIPHMCVFVYMCVYVCVIMMLGLKVWHERDKCYVSLRYNRQVCFLFWSHRRSPNLSSEKRVEACVYIMKLMSRG